MAKVVSLIKACSVIALVVAVMLVAAFNKPKPRPEPKAASPKAVSLETVNPVAVSPAAPVPQLTAKKITAGPVTFSRLQPNKRFVKGSFKITQGGEGSIPSYGTGGACLIADLNPFNQPARVNGHRRTCTKNADCEGLPGDWFGYCADSADDTPEKICWIRPGPDTVLCDKSLFHDPPTVWPVDVDNELKPVDISAPAYPPQLRGHVRWRIVACLNGSEKLGCRTPDASANGPERLEVFGKPYESDWTP